LAKASKTLIMFPASFASTLVIIGSFEYSGDSAAV
jgi:hypothetical protein